MKEKRAKFYNFLTENGFIERLRLISYIIAGILAGFGGVMQTARLGSATFGMGTEFLFPRWI